VLGLIGVMIALIVLTIVLAGVFLVRPSITAGATGKILAFIGLCVLPALCIGAGMSVHMQRSKQTSYCVSCHSMETHGKSLYLEDARYIPALHFQNHLVPSDQACYTCHTDYTMYGPLKDKLKGLLYLYKEYISSPPSTIHLLGKYSNLQCLHCHAGTRNFEEHLKQMPPLVELTTNHMSCLSSGCHDMVHNASEVNRLAMWTEGAASTSVVSEASSTASGTAPANSKPEGTTVVSKMLTGTSAGGATAARGKGIFDSQGCAGCHGEAGIGASGPALTNVSSQYPSNKLTAILNEPTAGMKAGGMVPLALDPGDMKALVSYMASLEKKPVSAAKSLASGSSSVAPAKAQAHATVAPKAPTESPTGDATTSAGGKAIFDSQGCGGCHGEAGSGGSGQSLTNVSSRYPPDQLTAILKQPTTGMKAAGMVPLSLNAADMQALVSYLGTLGRAATASPAPAPSSGESSPAPAKAKPEATAAAPKATTVTPASDALLVRGKNLFHSRGCGPCHGETGTGGAGPALSRVSAEYPSDKLTAILKEPTPGMKAAGMIPVTLNVADMEALVSYMGTLGESSASAKAQLEATAGASNASTRGSAGGATAGPGKGIYDAQGCGGCHGENGAGGAAPALTHIYGRYPSAKLSAILKAPTAQMKAAGMVPLSLNAADMNALVSYVSSLGGK
jgi:cytochrome c-type protein NapC